jgi:hypothetical protein
MNQDTYLSDPAVKGFIRFIVESWKSFPAGYMHTHEIPNRGPSSKWRKWREQSGLSVSPAYECLNQAQKEYWWDGDYSVNSKNLAVLSKKLTDSISSDSDSQMREAIFEVFKWGRVSTERSGTRTDKNRLWVENLYQNKDLINRVQSGTKCLTTLSTDLAEQSFDGENLRMNSSFTKVYALLIDGFPIYDGRVGAALGLMARLLYENSSPGTPLSPKLAFPWAPGKGKNAPNRNPSLTNYSFKRFYSSNHGRHAYWNILAGWILVKAAAELNIEVRELESALFMMGYKV